MFVASGLKKKKCGRPAKFAGIVDPCGFVLRRVSKELNDPDCKRHVLFALIKRGYAENSAKKLLTAASRDKRVYGLPKFQRNGILQILRGKDK